MLIIIILGVLIIAAVICSVIMISKRSNYFMCPLIFAAEFVYTLFVLVLLIGTKFTYDDAKVEKMELEVSLNGMNNIDLDEEKIVYYGELMTKVNNYNQKIKNAEKNIDNLWLNWFYSKEVAENAEVLYIDISDFI